MCCRDKGHFHQHHMDFGCCFPPRRFLTKDEQIERLDKYAKELENELEGLREYIDEIKSKPKKRDE